MAAAVKLIELISRQSVPCAFPEDLKGQLVGLLERLSEGESDSVLIVGNRGSGKSHLVAEAWQDFCHKHPDSSAHGIAFVRLNGFLFPDDKRALQAIALQLKREDVLPDDASVESRTLANSLNLVLYALKDSSHTTALVLILDEFDQFAAHSTQTLLYSLLDTSLQQALPMLLIGLSSRVVDVVDLLEKRVSSRFSQRQLSLFPEYDFTAYLTFAKQLLTLSDESSLPGTTAKSRKAIASKWNESVETAIQDASVQHFLEELFARDNSFRHLLDYLKVVVSSVDTVVTAADLVAAGTAMRPVRQIDVLKGLSLLDISLLVSARRRIEVMDEAEFNFAMVYREYLRYVSKKHSVLKFSKAVVFKAFDRLGQLELIVPAADSQTMTGVLSDTLQEYVMMVLNLDYDDVIEALHSMGSVPVSFVQWAEGE